MIDGIDQGLDTVTGVLCKHMGEAGSRPSIVLLSQGDGEIITYEELGRGSIAYQAVLADEGIRQDEPVVIILEHGRALIEAFFGAILHGSIPSIMPFLTEKLSPEVYRKSLQALIEVTRPSAIITYRAFLAEVEKAIQPGSSVRSIIVEDQVKPVGEIQWDEIPGLRRRPDDLVLLQHSSGTTGLQKGVALSHQAVIHQVRDYARAIEMTSSDVVVSWLPLYHDMGLIAGFIMPILVGAKLVLMSPFDWVRAPYRLLQAVSDYKGTLSWLPNFAYNFCVQKIRDRDLEGIDLSSWRAVINCSEPTRWESHEDFFHRFSHYGLEHQALMTCYAMAENVFAVTQSGMNGEVLVDEISSDGFQIDRVARPIQPGEQSMRMLSAGTAIQNSRVCILGENGEELPDRQIGEVALQSNCMLSGYYNRPDLTDIAFLDGWYLTGDLGYMVGEELFVTGRKKELIIVGGKNVYPQDLEEIAGRVDGVHPGRLVAFGVFNEARGTEDVYIVAEVNTSDPDERSDIRQEIRRQVNQGSDIVVQAIHLVDRDWLIKTSSGKIARGSNREKYLSEIEGTHSTPQSSERQ